MKKLKVAVFGAGAIARASHIPGYAANENCELTAIADVSPNRSPESAKSGISSGSTTTVPTCSRTKSPTLSPSVSPTNTMHGMRSKP